MRSKVPKHHDITPLQTAMFMYKAHNIQKRFQEWEGGYNLRGKSKFETPKIRTAKKQFSSFVATAKHWKHLLTELKQWPSLCHFKYKYKEFIFTKYVRVFTWISIAAVVVATVAFALIFIHQGIYFYKDLLLPIFLKYVYYLQKSMWNCLCLIISYPTVI